MFSRHGNRLPRFIAHPLGEGLLTRARAVSFLLLGLTAATGLGLIAFISQLGWPNVLGGPIPGLPTEHAAIQGRVVVASSRVPAPLPQSLVRSRPSVAQAPNASATLAASGVSGSNKAIATASPHNQGSGQPSSHDVPNGEPPSSQPPAPTPVSAPEAPPASNPKPLTSPSTSPSSSAVTSTVVLAKDNGKSKGSTASKAKIDHPVPSASAGKPPSHPSVSKPKPPSPPPVDPNKDDPSSPDEASAGSGYTTGTGHGHGHAYGHYGK